MLDLLLRLSWLNSSNPSINEKLSVQYHHAMFIVLCFHLIGLRQLLGRTEKFPVRNFELPSLMVVYYLRSQHSCRNMLRLVPTLESKQSLHLLVILF